MNILKSSDGLHSPAYTTIAQAQRTREFELIQHCLIEALDDERVQSALGSLALDLSNQAENLFLPDERHGILYLPSEYEDGQAYAMVPVDVDDRLLLDTSMQQQTPSRRHANGLSGREGPLLPLSSLNDHRAWALTQMIYSPDEPRYSSRPVITFSRKLLEDSGFFSIGPSVAAHEIQHAIDFDATSRHPTYYDDRAIAGLEFRGYFVGSAIAQSDFPGPHTSQHVADYLELSRSVEHSRVLASDPNAPFEVNDAMLDYALAAKLIHRSP